MSEQLQITLTKAATKRYLELMSQQVEAEGNEDIEPTFPSLQIEMSMFGDTVLLQVGKDWIEVGEAKSDIIHSSSKK